MYYVFGFGLETLQGDDSSFSLSDDDTKHLFNKTDDLTYVDTSN
jgi:hypothetical protein